MRPTEVLDAHGDLFERVQGRPDFKMATKRFAAVELAPRDSEERLLEAIGDVVFESFENTVKNAYDYRVTFDMCTLLEAASMELDDTDTWDLSLAPTDHGFVRFDRPIEVWDVRGKRMLAHFLVWGRVKDGQGNYGSGLWWYNDTYTESDTTNEQAMIEALRNIKPSEVKSALEIMQRASGRWSPISVQLVKANAALGPPLYDPSDPGVAKTSAVTQAVKDGVEPQVVNNLTRYVHALWLMLNQTITITADEFPDRAGRKRATRRGLPGKVTVIALRRAVYPHRQEGESLVEWSHRWPVRGHWAWRVCSADHPQAVTDAPVKGGIGVRVYIAPYIKGPDDKPLVLTEKVFDLAR